MEILKITKADIKDGRYAKGAVDFQGHIELEASLSWVFFPSLKATGYIFASAGTGIKAGEGIEAGWGIKAGEGIEAGWGIEAGEGIEAGGGIKAGEGIEAGWGIEAGGGIEAGEGIKAGGGIKAGEGIEAGGEISVSLRIFAGLIMWRKPKPEEMEIRCGKLTKGEVAYGNLVEKGGKNGG